MTEFDEIEMVASRFGLTLHEMRDLLATTDECRGLLSPSDVDTGLRQTVVVFLGVFGSTADRTVDPGERLVIDRFLARATDELVKQLAAAPHRPN